MPLKVEFIPIVPKKLFDVRAFSVASEKLLKDEAKVLKREFDKTTKTFKHRVTFATKNTSTRNRLSQLVFASDKPYFFVVRGTRVRWALMSQDFSAKTRARVIGSRGGKGGVVILGKRAMQARGIAPRPGIKAREFDDVIIKLRQPKFLRSVNNAFAVAAKKTNR